MTLRIHRYASDTDLVNQVADRLLDALIATLDTQPVVNLGLTGGRIATRLYERFAAIALHSRINFDQLHLWWSDERLLPMSDPNRNSQQALGALARTLPLNPATIHLAPTADGAKDADDAAFTYATELGDTPLNICLLSLGEDGHIASIFPDHPSFDLENAKRVIGVDDAPKPPNPRLTMTLAELNQSGEIWILASGSEKAAAVAKLCAGDGSIPASHLHGRHSTHLFCDLAAAEQLPHYQCRF